VTFEVAKGINAIAIHNSTGPIDLIILIWTE